MPTIVCRKTSERALFLFYINQREFWLFRLVVSRNLAGAFSWAGPLFSLSLSFSLCRRSSLKICILNLNCTTLDDATGRKCDQRSAGNEEAAHLLNRFCLVRDTHTANWPAYGQGIKPSDGHSDHRTCRPVWLLIRTVCRVLLERPTNSLIFVHSAEFIHKSDSEVTQRSHTVESHSRVVRSSSNPDQS